MAWPARYFETAQPPDVVAGSVAAVLGAVDRVPPDSIPARGFHGFDHAYSFNLKGTPGWVLVMEGDGRSKVVLFGIPSALGRSKFVKTLESAVGAVPGAQPQPFPGRQRAKDLKFG